MLLVSGILQECNMKTLLLIALSLFTYLTSSVQSPEWKIIKPKNTGILGNYVYSIAFEGNKLCVAGSYVDSKYAFE